MLSKLCTVMVLLVFTFAANAQDDDKTNEDTTKRPSWSEGLPERQKSTKIDANEFKPDINNEVELDMSDFGLKQKPKIEIDLPINSEIGVSSVTSEKDEEPNGEATDSSDPVAQPVLSEPEQIVPEASNSVAEELTQESIVEANENSIEEVDNSANTAGDTESVNLQSQDSESLDENNTQLAEESNIELIQNDDNMQVEPADSEAVVENVESSLVEGLEEVNNESPSAAITSEAATLNYEWKIIKRTPVKYPPKAAVDNIEGWVDVEVTINAAGEVISASAVKYSRRGRIFGRNAVKSVNEWLFAAPSDVGIDTNMTRIYKIEFGL